MTYPEALSGVRLSYTGGALCGDSQQPATMNINMYCDATQEFDYYDVSVALGDPCAPYVDVVSKAACARLDVSDLWGYLGEYSDYFGAFLIVAGTLLTIWGRKLIKPSVCIAGFLSTILLAGLIFYGVYLQTESQVADFWYFLGGGALVGIGVGLLLAWAVKFGAAVLAAWGGICGALILYETLLFRAE